MYLEALLLQYEAEIATTTANLNNYLVNGVGVAEHPDIVMSLDKLIEQLTTSKEKIAVVKDLLKENYSSYSNG